MTLANNDRNQPLVGYRTNEEWEDLLAQVAAMIEDLERLDDSDLHHKVFGTLQAIDALHREALHRLVRLFKEGVLEQVVTDPAIHTLMGMYDLLPSKQPPGRRGSDFLTPEERAADDAKATRAPVQMKRPGQADRLGQPHWRPLPVDHAIAEAEALTFELEEGAVIITEVDGTLHAVEGSCPTHGQIMRGGVLKGFSWICPLGPGCVYDIRNGARLGGGPGLKCHPVRTTKTGGLQIGFGLPFEPKLPAF
jgi:nitrite reductase/ring-hydroxylating ferredoxin subunit